MLPFSKPKVSDFYTLSPGPYPRLNCLKTIPFILSTVTKFFQYKALIWYLRKTVFISSCWRTFTTIARPCSRAICELTSSSVGSLGSPMSRGSLIISASFSLNRAMISGWESPSNFSCSSVPSSAILIFLSQSSRSRFPEDSQAELLKSVIFPRHYFTKKEFNQSPINNTKIWEMLLVWGFQRAVPTSRLISCF